MDFTKLATKVIATIAPVPVELVQMIASYAHLNNIAVFSMVSKKRYKIVNKPIQLILDQISHLDSWSQIKQYGMSYKTSTNCKIFSTRYPDNNSETGWTIRTKKYRGGYLHCEMFGVNPEIERKIYYRLTGERCQTERVYECGTTYRIKIYNKNESVKIEGDVYCLEKERIALGQWIKYYPNGKIQTINNYEWGKICESEGYAPNGQLIYKWNQGNDKCYITSYKNGKKLTTYIYNCNKEYEYYTDRGKYKYKYQQKVPFMDNYGCKHMDGYKIKKDYDDCIEY